MGSVSGEVEVSGSLSVEVGTGSVRLTVRVPEGAAVHLEASTGAGSVSASGVQVTSRTAGPSQSVEGVLEGDESRAVYVTVEVGMGDVDVRVVRG